MVTGQPFVKSGLKKKLLSCNKPNSIILFYKNTVSFPVSYKKRAQLAQQMYNFFILTEIFSTFTHQQDDIYMTQFVTGSRGHFVVIPKSNEKI